MSEAQFGILDALSPQTRFFCQMWQVLADLILDTITR